MCGQYFASYVVHRVKLWLPMIIHGYILSSRFLFGGLLHLCSAANLLHKSHESKTQIIYQMFHNHETNARVLVTPTWVQA